MATSEKVIDVVTSFYLQSGDFNGISLNSIANTLATNWQSIRDTILSLIGEGRLGVLTCRDDVNPHILRVGFPPESVQFERLQSPDLHHTCIYPRGPVLVDSLDKSLFSDEPYKRRLAEGEPQLAFQSFDLSVLESYRNDPRFHYDCNDIHGRICIRDAWYGSEEMPERDKVLLETFGFSHDEELNRAVAVFIRYLADLSPEHQQIWRAKELTGKYWLHPDYFRPTIYGDFPEGISIFDAFLMELRTINQMAQAFGREGLFHQDFGENSEKKPSKFGFLVRPTSQAFFDFVLLLDKLLSDNINKAFFKNDVPLEDEVTRPDGRIEVKAKGTLQILDLWLRRSYVTKDWTAWDEAIAALRKIRKLRQKPAHAIDDDKFDPVLVRTQRELITDAYNALKTLRQAFTKLPKVQSANIEIHRCLVDGPIWNV